MKFMDIGDVPESIEIIDVSPVAHEYGEGEGPVGKWLRNYVGVDSITAGPYTIDLIEKDNGEHVLGISSMIGENKISDYQSISLDVIEKIVEDNEEKNIPVDYYPKVRKIVDNLTHVGTTERSGITLPCMFADGKEALVFDGYGSPLIAPVAEASAEEVEAVLEAKGGLQA